MITCGRIVNVEPIRFAERWEMRVRKDRKQRKTLRSRFLGEFGGSPRKGVRKGVCVVVSPG